jgi:hypothetical protein
VVVKTGCIVELMILFLIVLVRLVRIELITMILKLILLIQGLSVAKILSLVNFGKGLLILRILWLILQRMHIRTCHCRDYTLITIILNEIKPIFRIKDCEKDIPGANPNHLRLFVSIQPQIVELKICILYHLVLDGFNPFKVLLKHQASFEFEWYFTTDAIL